MGKNNSEKVVSNFTLECLMGLTTLV